MAILTIRMPDDKHRRLKTLAQHRHISVNKLVEELSPQALSEFDSEVRFRALAACGDTDAGLRLLDELDTVQKEQGSSRLQAAPTTK